MGGSTHILRRSTNGRAQALGKADAATTALVLGAGQSTAGSRETTATANKNFIEFRFENTATSGDNRGIYNRLYLGGAGGGGESLRSFTTVDDVAAGTAHGAHISLNFNSTGSVTGLGVAGRNTLHVPNDASWAPGTIAALQAEIYSDGANSDTDGATEVSFIRIVNDGNASGVADVDDDAFLWVLTGGSAAAGNVFAGSTYRTRAHSTTYYLPVSTTENSFVFPAGEARIDFSSLTVAAANTDGGIMKAGTSGTRVVEDTADMKFMSFYFDNGATSGDNRGMYLRLYLTGAGGGGEAARIFTTVEDVAGGTAHGAHISLNFNSTGSITGLGVAGRNTLHLPNTAITGGTYAAVQAEIFSDGASSDASGATQYSLFRASLSGNTTGAATITQFMDFDIPAGAIGAGLLIDTSITTHTAYGGLAVNIPGVGTRWIALVSA